MWWTTLGCSSTSSNREEESKSPILTYKLFSLEKKDGQTKDRVEVWRKNLHGLTDELMKQAKVLEELGENGGAGGASDGGNDMKVNYFDHLVNQISKEIHDIMSIAANVLSLPRQYYNK